MKTPIPSEIPGSRSDEPAGGPVGDEPEDAPATIARRLLRGRGRVALATAQAADGWPYVSLVLVATDSDGAPLLLLSNLAEHTRNLKRDGRVSLLFDGTEGLADPLTGARLTLLGRLERSDEPRHRQRFLARHDSAATYADFGDFAFYRLVAERGHLVAGFGRIQWIEASALRVAAPPALVAAERAIVDHMNQDHADAVTLYATRLLGLEAGPWHMTGIDAEGLDLAAGSRTARLDFDHPVADAGQARAALVRLVKRARDLPAAV